MEYTEAGIVERKFSYSSCTLMLHMSAHTFEDSVLHTKKNYFFF